MSENLCKTCRWWNTRESYWSEYDNNVSKTCDRITASGGNGRRPARIYPIGHDWLNTAPDFGCALHEPDPRTLSSESR